MAKIICKECSGTEYSYEDGSFICKSCGKKYTMDDMKTMMVDIPSENSSATLTVEPVVPSDPNENMNAYIIRLVTGFLFLVNVLIAILYLVVSGTVTDLSFATLMYIYVIIAFVFFLGIGFIIRALIKIMKFKKQAKENESSQNTGSE